MFVHRCTSCDRDQLIFPSQVNRVTASERGPVLTFTCWCGGTQRADYSTTEQGRQPLAA